MLSHGCWTRGGLFLRLNARLSVFGRVRLCSCVERWVRFIWSCQAELCARPDFDLHVQTQILSQQNWTCRDCKSEQAGSANVTDRTWLERRALICSYVLHTVPHWVLILPVYFSINLFGKLRLGGGKSTGSFIYPLPPRVGSQWFDLICQVNPEKIPKFPVSQVSKGVRYAQHGMWETPWPTECNYALLRRCLCACRRDVSCVREIHASHLSDLLKSSDVLRVVERCSPCVGPNPACRRRLRPLSLALVVSHVASSRLSVGGDAVLVDFKFGPCSIYEPEGTRESCLLIGSGTWPTNRWRELSGSGSFWFVNGTRPWMQLDVFWKWKNERVNIRG